MTQYLASYVFRRGGKQQLFDGSLDVGDRLAAGLQQRLDGAVSDALELGDEGLLEDATHSGVQRRLGVVAQSPVKRRQKRRTRASYPAYV